LRKRQYVYSSDTLQASEVVGVAVKESGDAQTGEGSAEAGGYKQELKRTLGSFQVFAVSFAFISVAVGIFGT
jgi:hypothetical protein